MKDNRIINHWSLIAFANQFGSDLHVGTCKTSAGDEFPACSFGNGDKRTLVHFGESLEGGLTFEEICAQHQDLQIVQLKVDEETLQRRREKGVQEESYSLCKKGENAWQGGNFLSAIA